MSNYQIPASKVRFSIDPVAVSDLEVGEATLLGMRDVLQNFTDQYGPFISMTSYSSMYPGLDSSDWSQSECNHEYVHGNECGNCCGFLISCYSCLCGDGW